MHQALYREYRPEIFKEVLGQNTIINILKNQIETDSVGHAYLFCGTRGTGKTTTARLLAKAVNCLSENKPCGECSNCISIKNGTFIDLIEIDAASNNGVGDIRQIRESVIFPPAMGRKKVYIIDEVHMLSREAFNAFLKTLEEPPENVMFILATTEPQKLPQTILSRCLRMDFKRVSEEELVERMWEICSDREIKISRDTLKLVATNADGSVRDGLTVLDQCISGRTGEIKREDVLESIGAVGEEWYIDFAKWVKIGETKEVLILIDRAIRDGKDPRQILMGMINHYRNLLLAKYVRHPENTLNMSVENADRIKKQSDQIDLEQIDEIILELASVSRNMMTTTQPRILLEVAAIKISTKLSSQNHQRVNREQKEPKIEMNFERQENGGINSNTNSVAMPISESTLKNININGINESEIYENADVNKVNFQELFEERQEVNVEQKEKLLPDKEYIWAETIKMAKKEMPRMIILKNTYPKEMKNGEIHIVYENGAVKKYLEEDREFLQKILKDLTGENLRIKAVSVKGEAKTDMEETAQKLEDMLGIDVNLTD